MFLECDGEHYKVVYQDSKFFWVVSLSQFGPPKQINRCEAEKDVYDLPEDTAPDEFGSHNCQWQRQKKIGQSQRQHLLTLQYMLIYLNWILNMHSKTKPKSLR